MISVDGNALFLHHPQGAQRQLNFGIFDRSGRSSPREHLRELGPRGQLADAGTAQHQRGGQPPATINVSADGQTLFIYRNDNGDSSIYESKLVGEIGATPC